jgi:hypothetical protein
MYAHDTSFHVILSKNWPTKFVESKGLVDSLFGSWFEILLIFILVIESLRTPHGAAVDDSCVHGLLVQETRYLSRS